MCEKLWSPPLVLLVFHMHHLLDFTPSFTQDCQPFSFAVPSRTKNSTEKSVAESPLSVILSTIIFIDSSMFNLSARSHSSYWSLHLYVHCCLVTQLCLTLWIPWTPARQASLVYCPSPSPIVCPNSCPLNCIFKLKYKNYKKLTLLILL